MKYGQWLFLLASFLISSSASLPENQFSADIKRKILMLQVLFNTYIPQPKLLEESIVDGSILRNLRKQHSSISDSETEGATCESTFYTFVTG